MHINTLIPGTSELDGLLNSCATTHIDIGCGDGLFAMKMARNRPDTAVVGLDICLDNLARQIRRAPTNLAFVRADATMPQPALIGRFDSVSIAFPFGSLLRGTLSEDVCEIQQILAPARPGAHVQLLINESAVVATLGERGDVSAAVQRLAQQLTSPTVSRLDHTQTRAWSSSWAKRIGYGKPSVTWMLTGTMPASQVQASGSLQQPVTTVG